MMGRPEASGAAQFVWRDRELVAAAPETLETGRIVVADSWRVLDGRVIAMDAHRARFARSATGPSRPFWEAAIAAIPRAGDWFPRVEQRRLGSAETFAFRLRPSPPLRGSTVLLTAEHDPRETPTVKGPNIDALGRLRAHATERGADEVVLLARNQVVEGATSAIVWWRGDTLCVVGSAAPRVSSVTEATLLSIARQQGVPVAQESATPAELDGCELWTLSALHGITVVTEWIGGPSVTALPGRAAFWRDALERRRLPLP